MNKPENSETSALESAKEKVTEENSEADKKLVRKLSHNEFYERSPKSSEGKEKTPFRSAGRTKS